MCCLEWVWAVADMQWEGEGECPGLLLIKGNSGLAHYNWQLRNGKLPQRCGTATLQASRSLCYYCSLFPGFAQCTPARPQAGDHNYGRRAIDPGEFSQFLHLCGYHPGKVRDSAKTPLVSFHKFPPALGLCNFSEPAPLPYTHL